jgi:DNA-binding transcriptional MerR regulator
MKPTKVYYSITEVCKLTNLPSSTLRYWEEQFEQLSPYKDEKKNRYYSEQDIQLIKQIKFIRNELHITRIQAIRTELKNNEKTTDVRERVATILTQIRNELADIRSKI